MTGPPKLTRCQLEVAECLAKGWTYRETAEWLGVATETVRTHVAHALAKLPADYEPGVTMQKRLAFYYRERIAKKIA